MSAAGGRQGRRRERRAGFTLIECLVALVVFSVVAVVTQRGIVTARLGLDRVASTLAAEQVARSIIETELDRLVRGPGQLRGETSGLAWTIGAEPIVLPLPPAPARKSARRVAPQQTGVQNADGSAGGPTQTGQAQQNAAEPDISWRLLRVVVAVANGRGKPLTIETLHVVKDLP